MSVRGPSAKSILRLTLCVVSLAVVATACGESVIQVGEGDVVELRLTPDSARVGVGRTFKVQALPLDDTGALLVGQSVTFSTTAPGVATVDEDGVLTGVATGETEVTATAGTLSATSVVTVLRPPALELSDDTVRMSASIVGLNPPPDSILITNGGEIDLVGLTVDSIVYGAGAQDWLVGQLRSTIAPTALVFEGRTTSIAEVGEYVATSWISGDEAEGSPATVTVVLTMDDEPPVSEPTTLSIAAGDGQTQVTGLNVAVAPTVTVLDQFGDPLQGAVVDFAPSGSGSVGAASVVTNASGLAATTWTVDVGGSTLQSDGTYPNTLVATVQGTALSASFSADAVYSYATHVNPVLCVGCHTGSPPAGGLSLDGDPAADYDELILEPLSCDDDGAALPAAYRRVSTAGGVQASDDFSMLLRYTDPALSGIGACDFAPIHPKPLSADQLEILRAWIRSGAPNN